MRRTYRKSKKPEGGKLKARTNEEITAPQVFVIDDKGTQIGAMPTSKAIETARELGFDLVEVSPKAVPPVVRYLDFGKLMYQESRQARKAKAAQKKTETKNIRLSTRISKNDQDMRIKQAMRFMEEGHRVHLNLRLRGRENQHPNVSRTVVDGFVKQLQLQLAGRLSIDMPVTHKNNMIDADLSLKKT